MKGRVIRFVDAPRDAKVIVCGGRWYGRLRDQYPSDWARRQGVRRAEQERSYFFKVMDVLRPREIAQGGAFGADTLAREWATARGVPCREYLARWRAHGWLAGFKRNRRMFFDFEPEGTVAFPGGVGTLDMSSVTLDEGVWLVRIPRGAVDVQETAR